MKTFDLLSNCYDNIENREADLIDMKIINLLSEIRINRILDIGCGTGRTLKKISSRLKLELYGCEISTAMLNEASKKLNSEAELKNCPAENLDFDSDFFDVVFTIECMHHFPFPQEFIEEAYRVLNINGYLIIADIFYPWLRRQMKNLSLPDRFGNIKYLSVKEVVDSLKSNKFEIFYKAIPIKERFMICAKKSKK
jgi:27-O-demethylrifamycin SV methyltransferase